MKEVSKSPTSLLTVIWFLRYFSPYWYHWLFVLICVLLDTALSLAPPYITKTIIDDILPTQNHGSLVIALLVLAILTLSQLFLSFLSEFVFLGAANRTVRDIRVQLYRQIINLPTDFYQKHPTGELIFRLETDVGIIQSVLSEAVIRSLHSIFILICLFFILAHLNITLFFLSIGTLPIFLANLMFFQPRIRQTVESLQNQGAGVSSLTIERFNNVPLIQISNNQDYEAHRLRFALNALIRTVMINVRYSVSMDTISSGLVMATPLLILGWGGYLVMEEVITLGILIAFLQYVGRLFGPVEGLHDLYIELVKGLVSMRRVLEFMQVPSIESKHAGNRFFLYDHTIEFENIHLHFRDQPVLQGLNLKLIKGRVYALVGPSGSGKTTIANSLCGFYQFHQGSIFVDGVPLQEISLRDLREHVALVSQQIYLFDDTILENLRYGNFERKPEEIEHVIQQVGLSGLDLEAKIGEQGAQLSGGQQQRIALGRALLRPLELLILDEATSALDPESEKEILHRVRELLPGKTLLLISHRLSAIQGVDEVVCLAGGRVVEQGPPALLLSRQGYYARFVRNQQEETQVA